MFTPAELTTIATLAGYELKSINQLLSLMSEAGQATPYAEALRNERNLVGAIYGKAMNAARITVGAALVDC